MSLKIFLGGDNQASLFTVPDGLKWAAKSLAASVLDLDEYKTGVEARAERAAAILGV